jgi:hypothetical protein
MGILIQHFLNFNNYNMRHVFIGELKDKLIFTQLPKIKDPVGTIMP